MVVSVFSLGLSSFLGSSIQSQKKIQQFTTERVFKQGDGSLGGRDFLGEGLRACLGGRVLEGRVLDAWKKAFGEEEVFLQSPSSR